MDPKEIHLVADLRSKLASGTFEELDVHALFMMLRSYGGRGSPVREFGDFIAHRERNRGHVWRYLRNAKTEVAKFVTGGDINLVVQPIFSEEEMRFSLNESLHHFWLPPLPDSLASGVMYCMMSLLQGVTLYESGHEFGELLLGLDTFGENTIDLLGQVHNPRGAEYGHIVFPVLRIDNQGFAPRWSEPRLFGGVDVVLVGVEANQLIIREVRDRAFGNWEGIADPKSS